MAGRARQEWSTREAVAEFERLLDAAAPGEDLVCAGADLSPGTLLAGLRHRPVPDGPRPARPGPLGWWSPGPARRPAARGPARQPVAAAVAAAVRDPGRHRVRRGRRRLRRPLAATAGGSPATSRDAYRRLHVLGLAHTVECWRDGHLVGGLYGVARQRPVRRGVDVPPRDRRVEGGAGRPGPAAGGGRRPAPAARRPVAHRRTWRRLGVVEISRPVYLGLLDQALQAPAAAVRRRAARGLTSATARRTSTSTSSPSRLTSTSSWPRIRHQAGRSWAAAGSVDSTRAPCRPARPRAAVAAWITGSGQRSAAGVHDAPRRRVLGRRPRSGGTVTGPSSRAGRARARAHRAARRRNRSAWAARSSPSVLAGSPTRTLPWVSAPIAASTCDGSSVLDVHADPEPTANPAASSSPSSASPSAQQAGERQDVGEPVVGVAHHLDVGRPRHAAARSRATTSRRRAPAASRSASTACSATAAASAAARRRRRAHRRGRPASRGPRASGERHRMPARTTSTPMPGGRAPGARVGGEQVPGGGQDVVPGARRGVDQQRDAGGAAASSDLVDRLPGAHLAVRATAGSDQRGPGGCGRAGHGGGVDAPEPVDRDLRRRRRRRSRVPRAHGAECSTAECTSRCTGAAPRAQRPEHRRVDGRGVRAGEAHLLGAGAERRRRRPRARRRAAAGRCGPRGAAVGVGPAVVERGEQRLAGRRVQRRDLRGVQVRARRRRPRDGRRRRPGRRPPAACRARSATRNGSARHRCSPYVRGSVRSVQRHRHQLAVLPPRGGAPRVAPSESGKADVHPDDRVPRRARRGARLAVVAAWWRSSPPGARPSRSARVPAERAGDDRPDGADHPPVERLLDRGARVGVLVWGLIIWCMVGLRRRRDRRPASPSSCATTCRSRSSTPSCRCS